MRAARLREMHLKLKGSPIVVLVGFMGCGKSTVGRLLADRLNWTFVDLDEEIERRAGKPISEIFDREGESRFRDLEHHALSEQMRQARHGKARVVALGGGAFAEPRNRAALELEGVSIWLDCPVDQLWERVAGDASRPLARQRNDFERRYIERRPHYQRADFTLPAANDAPADVVAAILRLPLF